MSIWNKFVTTEPNNNSTPDTPRSRVGLADLLRTKHPDLAPDGEIEGNTFLSAEAPKAPEITENLIIKTEPKAEEEKSPLELQPESAEIKPEKSQEVKSINENISDSKEISERQFVFLFLKEINDLVTKGKELEELTNARAAASEEKQKKEGEDKVLRESARQIEESLKAFSEANEKPDLAEKLKTALNSFQDYLGLFEEKINEEVRAGRIVDNTLLTKINSKKTEISSLISQIGGQTNFDKIKKGINDAERISKIAKQQTEKGNVSKTTIEMVNTETVRVVYEDPTGIKMLLESDSPMKVIDILMRIFSNTQNNK